MELETSKLLYRVIKGIEAKFNGVIAYGYSDNGMEIVCLSDYSVYSSKEFASVAFSWRKIMQSKNKRILFAYCKPMEKELVRLANEDNLVMNV